VEIVDRALGRAEEKRGEERKMGEGKVAGMEVL
jgi:hypothetical protein